MCCGEGDSTEVGITIRSLKYDYAENLEIQEYKFGDSLNSLSVNKFTTKYKEDEITEFDGDGNILAKTTIKKGANGEKITTEYGQEGNVNYRKIENGNDTNYDDQIHRTKSYKNEQGNVKETWIKDPSLNIKNFILQQKEIEAETQKELRKTIIYYGSNNIEDSRRITVFEKTSNLEIEYFQIPKKGKKYHFKYQYKFDSVGNWISKTSSSEVTKFGKTYFEPYLIVKREIDYY